MRVILTHDVDSIKKPLRHILKVRKRFSIRDIIKHVIGLKNLYNNIEDLIALEDTYGFRSTFFVPVDLFPILEIEDILKELVKSNWEVGLHYVVESSQNRALMKIKKEFLQSIVGKVLGIRVHQLLVSTKLLGIAKDLGLAYDSSYRAYEIGRFSPIVMKCGILEIPIGIMDTDLFGRLMMNERKAIKYVISKIEEARKEGVITLLFHQESMYMKGGRIYRDILEYIYRHEYKTLTCRDVVVNLYD